jgi:hypothetical protein
VEDIILVGAVYGLTGGVITGTILAWQFRQPVLPGGGAGRKVKARSKDTGLVAIAGSVSGLLAAAMCAYLTPLLLWVRAGLGLGLADLTDLFSAILSDSVLCIPAVSALSIPLGIGGGYAGLLIARARGKPSPSPWIWGGSIVGGTIGYVVSSLLTAAVLRR